MEIAMTGFIQRLGSKFTKSEHVPLFILLAGVFLLRVSGATMIGEGGFDAVEEFHAAKKILFGMEYGFIHRTVRFAAILPQTLMLLISGASPGVYYFTPVVASLISTFFLFRTSVLIIGRIPAFIVVVLYSVFPQVMVDGVHPRVSSFSVMYMLIALYFLVLFFRRCTQNSTVSGSRLLVGAAIAVFLMYLAKEDSLFFLPVFFLMVWESRRRLADLMLFGGLLLFLYFGETLLYAMLTDFTLGRLDVIRSGHLENINLIPVKSVLHLFDRFRPPHMPIYYSFLIVSAIAAGGIIAYRERAARSMAPYLGYMIICYTGLMTFLLKSLTPLVPMNTFQSRYMNITLPLIFMVLVYAVRELIVRARSSLAVEKRAYRGPVTEFKVAVLASAFLVSVGAVSGIMLSMRNSDGPLRPFANHPFVRVPEYARWINESLEAGQPIFVRGKSRGERFKPIISQIDEWVRSGMSLEAACRRYGISEETYASYRDRYEQIGTKGFGIVENVLLDESRIRSHSVKVHSLPFEDGATFLFYDSRHYRPEDVLAVYAADSKAQYLVVSADPFSVKRSVIRTIDVGASRMTEE